MTTATEAANHIPYPGPTLDAESKVPPYILNVLQIVGVLGQYGHHILATIEQRAARRSFSTIARYFGTATMSVILAHIHRGLMRAVALDRMLRLRAARGHDLRILQPRGYRSRAKTGPAAAQQAQPVAPAAASPNEQAPSAPAAPPPPTVTTTPKQPLTFATLPSMAQIEAEVRRRPVGSTLVDICRDLGVSPALCDGGFWNRIFAVVHAFRGSCASLMLELTRRERRFDHDVMDRFRDYDWPEETREGNRRVLGFMIGEPPVNPFQPAPAGAPNCSDAAAPSVAVTAAAARPP